MTTQLNEKSSKIKQSISLKLLIVVALSLLLLIPSTMVTVLINGRESTKSTAVYEITSKWGLEQTITGPVLLIPYTKKNSNNQSEYRYFHILPNELTINGEINPMIKYRGIYKVILYTSKLHISGTYKPEDFTDLPDNYEWIDWADAKFIVGISDVKGLNNIESLNWNDQTLKFLPGSDRCSMFQTGLNARVTVNANTEYKFSMDMDINGSEAIYFTPVGNSTTITLSSAWKNPSFDGATLPSPSNVTDSGFTATWKSTELNRNFPQKLSYDGTSGYFDYQKSGVKLFQPVDTYQKSTRSVKYAFLFIILTFLIIFFSEITGKNRVHPVQYLITGIALVVFYSLLIALAEHIPFNYSYLISSVVIISMITIYIRSIFKNNKTTLVVGTLLVLLYAYLFTILQIADYALLLGNIGLVIILGLVMFYSKKVDWYGNQNANNNAEIKTEA